MSQDRVSDRSSRRSWPLAAISRPEISSRTTRKSWRGRSVEALEKREMLDCGMCQDMRAIEDQRALNLVPDSLFAEYSVKSGSWDDPTVWSLGRAPQNGDNVLIKDTTSVTITADEAVTTNSDGSLARRAVNLLRVDGTLQFDSSAVDATHPALRRLLVDTIVVSPANTPMLDASGNVKKDTSGNPIYLFQNDDAFNTYDTTAKSLVYPLHQGSLLMGTVTSPVPAGAKAEIVFADNGAVGAIDRTKPDINNPDPFELSRGLVAMGPVRMYGQTVTSFVAVYANNADGSTTLSPSPTDPVTKKPVNGVITLAAAPVGWQVGDRVVLTGDQATTLDSKGVIHNDVEQFGIAAISADGLTITLDKPIVYTHTAPAGASIYVSDVTRNVVLRSESITTAKPVVDQYGIVVDNGVMHRGHVMFMHDLDVHVSGVGFYGLGRTDKRNPLDDTDPTGDPSNNGKLTDDVIDSTTGQRVMVPEVDANGNPVIDPKTNQPVLVYGRTGLNQRARYAVHFHHAGADDWLGQGPIVYATVDDSAVVDSPGWGIVNHGSDVNVTGNVVFNAVGAGFVTEEGDELGSFVGNIAIQSQGSGNGIESRRNVQDFGHEGDGFWFQGGFIDVQNNIATNQRSSGFVFFPVGLQQKMPMYDANGNVISPLTTTTVSNDAEHSLPASWFDPKKVPTEVAVGDVPLKSFSGNTAYGVNDGFESWFTMLGLGNSDPRRLAITNFTVFATRGNGLFDPYTNHATFTNVRVLGNVYGTHNEGFARNDVTRNFTYTNVDVEGFKNGINAPVNGTNLISGGTFENVNNIYVATAQSRDRVVDIESPTFVPLPTSKVVSGKSVPVKQADQTDIWLQSNFNPKEHDITTLFNPDVIKLGTVVLNGKQLYYLEQAATAVPFSSPPPDQNVPLELQFHKNPDGTFSTTPMTNQDLFNTYGLAIGGVVAPADATTYTRAVNGIAVHGLVGSPTTYVKDLVLKSAKYTQFKNAADPNYASVPDYTPVYKAKDASGAWLKPVTLPVSTLHQGWNLITINFTDPAQVALYGPVRTLLVYGDDIAPTFSLDSKVPLTVNKADVDNGQTFFLNGKILDDSFGSRDFRVNFALNDKKFVRDGIQTDSLGNTYVVVRLVVTDFAGNRATQVISDPSFKTDPSVLAPETGILKVVLQVTTTAPLLGSLGIKSLPAIIPSETLIYLISGDLLIPPPDKKS